MTYTSCLSLLPHGADGRLSEDLRIKEISRHEEVDGAQSAADLPASSFEPYFVMPERHVKAPFGGTAYLRCRIYQLGDRIVSTLSSDESNAFRSDIFPTKA